MTRTGGAPVNPNAVVDEVVRLAATAVGTWFGFAIATLVVMVIACGVIVWIAARSSTTRNGR